MRRGVRIGVDVGKARIGLARTDAEPILAVPVETVQRHDDPATGLDTALNRILELVDELNAMEVVVGLPVNLRGEHTASTEDAQQFAVRLAAKLAPEHPAIAVRLVDERLSTVSASQSLRAAGITAKNQRQIIDQQAAVVLLQHAIDAEKTSETAPGQIISLSAQ